MPLQHGRVTYIIDKDMLRTISLTDDGSQWYESYIVKNCTGVLWQHLETSRIYTEPLQITDRNGDILYYQKAYHQQNVNRSGSNTQTSQTLR